MAAGASPRKAETVKVDETQGALKPTIPKQSRKSATGYARLQVGKKRKTYKPFIPGGRKSLLTEPQLRAIETREQEEKVRNAMYDAKKARSTLALCLLGKAARSVDEGVWGGLCYEDRAELVDKILREGKEAALGCSQRRKSHKTHVKHNKNTAKQRLTKEEPLKTHGKHSTNEDKSNEQAIKPT